jgi:hypothetical protein
VSDPALVFSFWSLDLDGRFTQPSALRRADELTRGRIVAFFDCLSAMFSLPLKDRLPLLVLLAGEAPMVEEMFEGMFDCTRMGCRTLARTAMLGRTSVMDAMLDSREWLDIELGEMPAAKAARAYGEAREDVRDLMRRAIR